MKRSGDSEACVQVTIRQAVRAAIVLALLGDARPAFTQQAPAPVSADDAILQEIVVTANHRSQAIEEVPYNISAISGDELAAVGVTDFASLMKQVPGLSMEDLGTRFATSNNLIIRGINADSPAESRSFRAFDQSPVSTYLGNSPIGGYFDINDVQRVEVLKGPQGTLYGAGALGGAVRVIPNAPQLDVTTGRIEVSGGFVDHSSEESYGMSGVLNVPIGDTLALRVSGKYRYDPGFIDVYGLLQRTGPQLDAPAALANPNDPVNSPPIVYGQNDWNTQETFTGRTSLLWQPTAAFNAVLAYTYAHVTGNGGPVANAYAPGGPYYWDPSIIFPSGGDYKDFSAVEQPFKRRTDLASLDLSYDAGFATVSSTSSYYTTQGSDVFNYGYTGGVGQFGGAYYTGSPANPRYLQANEFSDNLWQFSQEVRLVSATGADRHWDYVVGAYFELQHSNGNWNVYNPGSTERSVLQGCTAPYFSGASFPDCLVVTGSDDQTFIQTDAQIFRDKSLFGELTWHVLGRGQITFGARHFWEDFSDQGTYIDYPFPSLELNPPFSNTVQKTVWKVNPSYEYAEHQFLYATWSQGFRRGGVNAFPLSGPFQESPTLHTYAPDTTDNYEVGLKGRFANGLTYSTALFDIDWHNPQISGTSPVGNLLVFNAQAARSRGFEFQANGPLLLADWSYGVGITYADAIMTEPYSLPANNGFGHVEPGELTGAAGTQLPGSPKTSGVASINYNRPVTAGYDLAVTLNWTYRSAVPLLLQTGASSSEPYSVGNLSAAVTHNAWMLTGYASNFTDKRVVIYPAGELTVAGGLQKEETVNRPREIGLRLAYKF